MDPSFFVSVNPARHQEQLFSGFVQDEITLFPDRLKATLGSKFERYDYTGFEIQPSGRLLWTPTEKQTVWAAVSRAVRTPSRFDLDGRANLQVFSAFPAQSPFSVVSSFGNPDLKSETLIAYELPSRIEITKNTTMPRFTRLPRFDSARPWCAPMTVEPGSFPLHTVIPTYDQIKCRLLGQTYGVELSAHWNVTDTWHLTASYSWLQMHINMVDPLLDTSPRTRFNSAPSWICRAIWNSTAPSIVWMPSTPPTVWVKPLSCFVCPPRSRPSSLASDENLELGVWGQNLIDDRHTEFTSYKNFPDHTNSAQRHGTRHLAFLTTAIVRTNINMAHGHNRARCVDRPARLSGWASCVALVVFILSALFLASSLQARNRQPCRSFRSKAIRN